MSSEKRDASPEASPLKGPAPKAIPEDTSDVTFEDGIPLSPMADPAVQFIPATPANGDAKVEIGDSSGTTPTFVGLGKEELMKYAKDPFWVKLRWFLFILFWVLWIAMLAGAIVIIVLAPRCAEKKVEGQTYLQIKASDLAKKDNAGLAAVVDLGVSSIVLTDALAHSDGEPEAVTQFDAFHASLKEGLTNAINELKAKGTKVLLQIVPNHSGVEHEWFKDNVTVADRYVWGDNFETDKSPWVLRGADGPMWQGDFYGRPDFGGKRRLQQFAGKVSDLNFRNEQVVDAFKGYLSEWRKVGIAGFSIGKASFLVENITNLMNMESTINQPENVGIVSTIVGRSDGNTLVELDQPSNETLQQYISSGLIPVIKIVDASDPSKTVKSLETINSNPKAVVDLSKLSSTSDKDRLVQLLVNSLGSHVIAADSSDELLKNLIKFQKENPRAPSAEVNIAQKDNIITVTRTDGDKHITLANFGPEKVEHHDMSVTGSVALAVPKTGQGETQLKVGSTVNGHISLDGLSGVVIKLNEAVSS